MKGQSQTRAQSLFDEALRYKNARNDSEAFDRMQRAIQVNPAYDVAYSTLGEWYFIDRQYAQAAKLFNDASLKCANGAKRFALPLAKSLLYSGNITAALPLISANASKLKEWQQLKAQAFFMQQAMQRPWPDTIFNMGPRINTRFAEMYPFMAADGKTIFYTRRTNGIDEDFYRSDIDSCGDWIGGVPLGYPLNTPVQEAASMISADRHYMFFMRCENRSVNGWDKGGCDLYMAYTADSIWSAPESFGATINTPGYEGMPCLSSDNRELYFVSDREGGYGGLDIWVTRFEHGRWQMPRNLGPEINSAGNETAPHLFADNNTLYFSSDGRPGMGGSDLFMSHKTGDTTWANGQNLGYPINTVYDEASICLSSDGKKAWFASDRDSVSGNFDLYEMNLPQPLQPSPVTFVKGYVYDSISKERLNYASIYITDVATGKELYQYTSNRGDGSFMFSLPMNKTYALMIDRVGYQDNADTIMCNQQYLMHPLQHNLALLPAGYQKPLTDSLVLTVLFKKSSTTVSDSLKEVINATLSQWLPQKDMQIFVNGYTDDSGTPLVNEQISYQRANKVHGVLTSMGFPAEILETRGWGEANPVVANDSTEHRDQNRRVEIIIRK